MAEVMNAATVVTRSDTAVFRVASDFLNCLVLKEPTSHPPNINPTRRNKILITVPKGNNANKIICPIRLPIKLAI